MSRLGENKMEKIIWNKESWSVGHSLMDDQHQQILALINKMIEIRQGKRPKSDLLTALSLLSQQITHHFGAEGVVLLSVKMPNLEEHIKSHEQFSSKLREFLLDCNGLSSEQTIDFLVSWWTDHILHEDTKYKHLFIDP